MLDPGLGYEWDFTPVIKLIHSFTSPVPLNSLTTKTTSSCDTLIGPRNEDDSYEPTTSLGDFKDIWKFIGDSSRPAVGENYTKTVRWRDEVDGADLAHNDEKASDHWLKGSEKTQRKKGRGRSRRKADSETLTNGNKDIKKGVTTSSENEPEIEEPKKPNRTGLIHELLDRPLPEHGDSREQVRLSERAKPQIKDEWPVAEPKASPQEVQQEKAFAATVAKKTELIGMLKERFIEERSYLSDPNTLQQVEGKGMEKPFEGLHVFVDASNIMIGFHDVLKFARSLPRSSRMRRQQISFHSLSLILSRGRPIAKSVVVGSDNFPEMAEAKLIGYETSILDRVQKAKELTPRQKRFANRENGATFASSGSETTAAVAQYAPEKWVEQAVDEILHLKMMESLVDAAEPSTMVLATGDAAVAEFSAGFLKMVERSLGKGWKVELACWKHNMSAAYKKKDFRQKWGERFRVVELDDFVELLSSGA